MILMMGLLVSGFVTWNDRLAHIIIDIDLTNGAYKFGSLVPIITSQTKDFKLIVLASCLKIDIYWCSTTCQNIVTGLVIISMSLWCDTSVRQHYRIVDKHAIPTTTSMHCSDMSWYSKSLVIGKTWLFGSVSFVFTNFSILKRIQLLIHVIHVEDFILYEKEIKCLLVLLCSCWWESTWGC